MADGPAFISFFPARYIHPCPSEHSQMPWPTDLHLFIYFWTGAFIHVQGKHSRMPWLTDRHLFVFLQPVACIQALISIPHCLSHYISIYFLLFNYPPGTANFIIDCQPWHAHQWAEEQFFHLPLAWQSLSGLMVHD